LEGIFDACAKLASTTAFSGSEFKLSIHLASFKSFHVTSTGIYTGGWFHRRENAQTSSRLSTNTSSPSRQET
jgi:hypothetical protein